jgi:hypothetical protein
VSAGIDGALDSSATVVVDNPIPGATVDASAKGSAQVHGAINDQVG